MFIHVYDKDLKNKLLGQGFKLLYEQNDCFVFVLDSNIKFNFSEIPEGKFIFSNRLTF